MSAYHIMIHNDVNLSTSPASPPSSPPASDTPASNSFPLSENHDLLRAYEQGGGGGGVAAGIPAINISIHSPNANHVLGEYNPNPHPASDHNHVSTIPIPPLTIDITILLFEGNLGAKIPKQFISSAWFNQPVPMN